MAIFLPYLDNGIIKNTDHEFLGRCYTALPTSHMVSRKIQEIKIGLKINRNGSTPRVLFHAPGNFRNGNTDRIGYLIGKKSVHLSLTSVAFIFEYENAWYSEIYKEFPIKFNIIPLVIQQ